MSTDPYIRALQATKGILEARLAIFEAKKEPLDAQVLICHSLIEIKQGQIDAHQKDIASFTELRADFIDAFNPANTDSKDASVRKIARKQWKAIRQLDAMIQRSSRKHRQAEIERNLLWNKKNRLYDQATKIWTLDIQPITEKILEIEQQIRDYQSPPLFP